MNGPVINPLTPTDPTTGAVLPYQSSTTSTGGGSSTSSTSRKVKSPDAIAADAALSAATAQQIGSIDARTENQLQVDAAKLEAAKQQQADAEEAAMFQRLAREERDADIRRFTSAQSERRTAMERDAKPTTYWEDRGTPAKILSAILVGLGAGAASGGGRNTALDIYQRAEDQDRQIKLDRLKASTESYHRSTDDIAGAHDRYRQGLADIENSLQARNMVLQRQIDLATAKIGGAETKAKAAETKAVLQQSLAKSQQQQAQDYAATKASSSTAEAPRTSVTTVSGDKAAGGGYERKAEAINTAQQAELSGDVSKLPIPTQEERDQMIEQETRFKRQEESEKHSGAAQTVKEVMESASDLPLVGGVIAKAFPKSPTANVSVHAAESWQKLRQLVRLQTAEALGPRAISNPELVDKIESEALPRKGESDEVAARKVDAILRRAGMSADAGGKKAQKLMGKPTVESKTLNNGTRIVKINGEWKAVE